MTGDVFPPMRWRRTDVPGREEAHLERAGDGWLLRGRVEVDEEGTTTQVSYRILCDEAWCTRSAELWGEVGDSPARVELTSDGRGSWFRDGVPVPAVDGALDVDLSLTPSTNMLPIRRLRLEVGASASVRAAWLRFPDLRLEPLEQTYTREAEARYRFDAVVDGQLFTARLTTDGWGRVVSYEGLWEAEEKRTGGHGATP